MITGVMRETVVVATIGLIAGGAAAYASSQVLRSMLFGVTHHDPVAFAVCPVILMIAAVLAACIPAVRASRMDPAQTLREG